jgi:hypothetical protein
MEVVARLVKAQTRGYRWRARIISTMKSALPIRDQSILWVAGQQAEMTLYAGDFWRIHN